MQMVLSKIKFECEVLMIFLLNQNLEIKNMQVLTCDFPSHD